MSYSTKEIVLSVLRCLNEGGLKEAAHTLERESGLYFDLKHFEAMVLEGKWDDAEYYLSGFTKVEDNNYSTKIYFEIRKQKYLEALDINDCSKAVDILTKDLKVFAKGNEVVFKKLTQLLTFNNIRECEELSTYRDANSARKKLMDEIKKIIERHPLLKSKLEFPSNQSPSKNRMDQNPAPAPSCYSGPSTSAPTNPETASKFLGDPNEIFEGRPSVTYDEDNALAAASTIEAPRECQHPYVNSDLSLVPPPPQSFITLFGVRLSPIRSPSVTHVSTTRTPIGTFPLSPMPNSDATHTRRFMTFIPNPGMRPSRPPPPN